MAFPVVGAIQLAVKIASKVLKGKPKEVIEEAVDSIIRGDKEIRTELMKSRQFYLEFFRPDLMSQWGITVKNLWRPFVAVMFSLFNMVFYIVTAIQGNPQMPDKYFLTVSTGIIFTIVLGRTAEKIRKKIV